MYENREKNKDDEEDQKDKEGCTGGSNAEEEDSANAEDKEGAVGIPRVVLETPTFVI